MWIPVSGTVFLVLLAIGGVLWVVKLSTRATRATKRSRGRTAREATRPRTGDPAVHDVSDDSTVATPLRDGALTAPPTASARGAARGAPTRRTLAVLIGAVVGVVVLGVIVVHHLRPDGGCGLSADEVSSITGQQDIRVDNGTDDPSGITGKVCLYSAKGDARGTGFSLLVANFHGGSDSGAVERTNTSGERCSSRRFGAAEKAYVCVDQGGIDARFGPAGWSCEVSLGGVDDDLGTIEGQVEQMVTKVVSQHQCA